MRGIKLLYFVTEDWYFCSHRLSLAIAAKNLGCDVIVVTRVSKHGDLIRSHGLNLIHLEISRSSKNIFTELKVVWQLLNIYREQKPNIVHHVALKPVLYGSVAAKLARVPIVVNALAGLGFVFVSKNWGAKILRPLVESLFRLLLNRSNSRVILQNPDDIRLLISHKVLVSERTALIRGSGVDLNQFHLLPESDGLPLVVLVSRMLWDKGVGEFVEAASHLKKEGVAARFALVGEGDSDNPSSISNYQLQAWKKEGAVEWWGRQADMPFVFSQSHIVCLPSYREGLPKALIEAAACGRAIVTTDVPGCREIVHDGINGFLVPLEDSNALANALRKLIENAPLRRVMGKRGREMVEMEFSIEHVVAQTLALYQELILR